MSKTGQAQPTGTGDFKEYLAGAAADATTWAGTLADWIMVIGPGSTIVTTEAGAGNISAGVPAPYNRTITTDSNEPIAVLRGPFTAFVSTTATRVRMGVGPSPVPLTAPASVLAIASAMDGIVAGTTRTQVGATAITTMIARIGTATAVAAGTVLGDGVQLPVSTKGAVQWVYNPTANNVQLYTNVSDVGGATINALSGSAGVPLPPGDMAQLVCATAGAWSYEAGYGCVGYLPTELACDAFVAGGTTQATAPVIPGAINTVATCAAGAGFQLPMSAKGLSVVVQFTCANTCLAYTNLADTGATLNGSAGANGMTFHPGDVVQFNATASGAWNAQPMSPRTNAFNTASNTSSFSATGTQISGGTSTVDLALTGALAAAGALTLPTLAALIVAMHAPAVGTAFKLKVLNQSSTNFPWTITTAAGWTLSGSMVIPAGTWSEFDFVLNSLTTATLQFVESGPNTAQQPPVRTGAAGAQTNATATMANLADLTMQVQAGQKVSGIAYLFAKNSVAGEGLQFDLGGGTATWTSIEFGLAGTPAGATVGVASSTAIATALTCTSVLTTDACYPVAFSGVVNAGGTLIPRFAEVSHTSGTATVEINSTASVNTTAN